VSWSALGGGGAVPMQFTESKVVFLQEHKTMKKTLKTYFFDNLHEDIKDSLDKPLQ
jgi:hypothetical protein